MLPSLRSSILRLVFSFTVLLAYSVLLASMAASAAAQTIPSPQLILGHKPGDDFYLANYEESLGYFQKLAASSDKIRLSKVGKTSEGRDWHIAIISSAENLRNVEKYRDIAQRVAWARGLNDEGARKLACEGKAIVHIDGGLHATEVANAQHTIQLAYDLVSNDSDPKIRFLLDNVILVLWFSMNPDGQDMVVDWYRRNLGTPYEVSPLPWLYLKYVGHDNNRDGYMNNILESQVVTRVTLREWQPMIYFCHHQTAPFPTRIWIPPFAEPVSSNVHPLTWRWVNLIGTAMAAYLDRHGLPGSTHQGSGFDDWYPGYNDAVNNYRHIVSFWTETALFRYATPRFYTVQDFPKEYQDLRKETLYASPWQGGWWRLADAVRYMIAASMSVLDTAARYREELIFNRYQAGRDVINQFRQSPPYAYVIPQRQRDPQTAALLLEKMQFNGIDICQTTDSISLNGREYPAGTWLIRMDQPFALLVKDLFEIQHYPDLRETPSGPPELPYDVAGWTLPLQMGVEVAVVTQPLTDEIRSKLKILEKILPSAGSIEGAGSTFVFDRQSNAAFKAVNRILKYGGAVSIAGKPLTVGGRRFDPGAFVVSNIGMERMQALAADLALKIQATAPIGDAVTRLAVPRIGLYSPWVANMDEGWTRWVLDQHEFSYAVLHNAEILSGYLREQYDVLVIAEMSAGTILDGHKTGTIPAEYAGGIGSIGLANLKEFVRAGGTLVTLGNASLFAVEHFKLPLKNVLQDLKREEFFCSGSILKAELRDNGHPLTYGLPALPAIFFARNPAFDTGPDFKGTVLITYPKDQNPLLSGYLLHPEKIQGKAAALDVNYGSGHIILYGFRPQWRGQPHGTFKLLFNALYYFPPSA